MTGIVVVDKPRDWTSHDVVAKLRRVYGTRRIGHGGTLDPLATGVLPVFLGRATRAAELLAAADKQYVAGLRFGLTTDTQDVTGRVLSAAGPLPARAEIEAVLPRFLGEQEQVPPMYSALKKNGRKLYELARQGVEVERPARTVTIRHLELLDSPAGEWALRVDCSKGTYVRTLCHDIGAALGCGAVMTSLRRTAAGAFSIEQAVPLGDIVAAFEAGEDVGRFVLPLHLLFADRPALTADPEQERRVRNGAAFRTDTPAGEYRIFSEAGEFLALGRCEGGEMRTIKSFFEVT